MHNQHNIPRFKFVSTNLNQAHFRWILAGDEAIHHVTNLNEFYKEFGYSEEMAKAGILPDEFIWEEYIKDSEVDFDNCIQMHIVEYLNKHSPTFKEKYGNQREGLLASHAIEREARGVACFACRMQPFCNHLE